MVEVCTRRLRGFTKLSDEMRLAGCPDSTPEIDVCAIAPSGASRRSAEQSTPKTLKTAVGHRSADSGTWRRKSLNATSEQTKNRG
jgi:hypothetical protein